MVAVPAAQLVLHLSRSTPHWPGLEWVASLLHCPTTPMFVSCLHYEGFFCAEFSSPHPEEPVAHGTYFSSYAPFHRCVFHELLCILPFSHIALTQNQSDSRYPTFCFWDLCGKSQQITTSGCIAVHLREKGKERDEERKGRSEHLGLHLRSLLWESAFETFQIASRDALTRGEFGERLTKCCSN